MKLVNMTTMRNLIRLLLISQSFPSVKSIIFLFLTDLENDKAAFSKEELLQYLIGWLNEEKTEEQSPMEIDGTEEIAALRADSLDRFRNGLEVLKPKIE